jgi:hypothetical protein
LKKKMNKQYLTAEIRAETFDAKAMTVDVVASSGARVKKGGFFTEPFIQELEISKKAMKLARFRNGAPVLDNHGQGKRDNANEFAFGIRDVMGVVENPRIETITVEGRGKIPALVNTVRFSDREEFQGVIKDIEKRIIRNVSIGFNINKNKEIKDENTELRVFRAIDWEPVELSFVPAGADPESVTRGLDNNFSNECEFEFLSTDQRGAAIMEPGNENVTKPAGARTVTEPPKVDEAKLRQEAVEAERKRSADIRTACGKHKIETEKTDDMITRGITVDEARNEILDTIATRDKATATSSTNIEVGVDNTQVKRHLGISSALILRHDPSFKFSESQEENFRHKKAADEFRNFSLLDCAAECLEAKGINTRGMSKMNLATRGLHSTSDFPEILANVTNKTLRRSYEQSPATWAPFTRIVEVSDFKEIARTQLGDASQLQKKLENGEYTRGTIGEAAEKYFVEEYGKVIAIGRKVLVNDDLNAMTQIPAKMGIEARNLESDLVWNDLNSNPTMGDGNALFSAPHSNVGTPVALTEPGLAEARALLRLQTGLSGLNKLNLTPAWLYVPVTLETTADKLVSTIIPNTTTNVNIFGPGGKTPLTNIAEPRIDDASITRYYVMADLRQIDQYEMAMLQGERGPVTDQQLDFNTDGVSFKIRHSVGVKAIDWRGMVRNVGA